MKGLNQRQWTTCHHGHHQCSIKLRTKHSTYSHHPTHQQTRHALWSLWQCCTDHHTDHHSVIVAIVIPLLVSYSHHCFFMMLFQSTPCPSSPMDADEWLQNHMCERFAEIAMDFEPTVPTTEPPQPIQLQEEAGPSQFPQVLPPVFTGTPVSQPTPPGFICTPKGYLTRKMLALDTLASRAGTPPSPQYFPPGERLLKKKALSKVLELSIFDILNTF
jgi:hypothetical protein